MEPFVYPDQDVNNPDRVYQELGDSFAEEEGEPVTPRSASDDQEQPSY